MLRVLTGSARSDVSGETIARMVKSSVETPNKKYIIIVPEQFTLQTQKRVVEEHPNHACMNIDIVSFDRLAHVVLSKLGKDVTEILDDVGKALILRNVLNDIGADLTVYGTKIHFPGFLEEIKSLVTEFKQYRIDDNELFLMEEEAKEKGSLLAAKIQDIRLIYRKFNEEIEDKYTTSEEVLDVFARMLPESDFINGAEIYLDGFTGFTPIQLRLIEEMLKAASEVTCSVTIPTSEIKDVCKEYELFAFPNNSLEQLKTAAANAGVTIEISNIADDISNDMNAIICSCPNPMGEVEEVAARILELVRTNQARFRDIAVLTTDMEGYYPIIRSTFDKAEISSFIDFKASFLDNTLVRFVLAALECCDRGLTYDNVFNVLKCGLTELTLDECSLLENYCLEFNIKGRGKWEGIFTANREIRKDSGEYVYDLTAINGYREKAVKPLLKFYGIAGKSGKRAVKLYCRALSDLLSGYKTENQIQAQAEYCREQGNLVAAKQYEQIYGKITELIEKINLLLGTQSVSIREFRNIIEGGICEMKIGTIPPSIDALVVGDLTRTRIGNVSHVFIMGMNEGAVPSGAGGSALFTQREREFLRKKHEIAPTIQENIYIQRYYLYLAFNKPEKQLCMTYANTSLAGTSLEATCILQDIGEFVDETKVKRIQSSKVTNLWKNKAKDLLCSEIRQLKNGKKHNEELKCSEIFSFFAKEEPEIIRMIARSASFTNVQTPLDDDVALALYGDVLKGSVSRYESFYNCPYRHFLTYGLRLEERREYQVQATDLGTIYHDSLEKYSKRLKAEGISFRDVPDDYSHQVISESVREAIDEIGNDILSSSARNEFFKKRIEEITSKTTDVLRNHVKAGLFEPTEYEFPFEEQISKNVVFKGKIDRIDIYDGGDVFIKIVDYKSGHKSFDIKDIYTGVQLQLVAYVDSAIKKIKENYPERNVRPGGIYYYLINDKYETAENNTEKKNRMSGLTLCEEQVVQAIDKGLGKEGRMASNIVPVTYTKSGFDSRSIMANEGELSALIQFVNNRIIEAGEKIRNGEISLAPIYGDGNTHTGCSFCPYGDICKFEPGCFGSDYVELDVSKKEMEDEVYGRNKMD